MLRVLPRVSIVLAVLGSVAVVAAPVSRAQERRVPGEEAREQGFIDGLRREDPASADQYVHLRDARMEAIAELRRVQGQYGAAGPELRSVFVKPLRAAERRYVEASLALIDFLEKRDRRILEKLQEEIGRVNTALEQHRRTRADLEKMLREP